VSPIVIVAIALVLAGAIAFVLLRRDGGSKGAKVPAVASGSGAGRVSVERYRASYRQRLEAARQVVARRRAAQVTAERAAGVGDGGVRRVGMPLGRTMMEPQCILGPAELCATIDDTVTACDDGDGQACLAVGQYLIDTPPRPMVALSFLLYACRAGEQEGCARMEESKQPMTAPCAEDPFRCAWTALKAKDKERMDEACTEGVADACTFFLNEYEQEPERARTYLEHSCQLGNPMACMELGRRLSPQCKEAPEEPCYAPDADQAAEARTIACEAGFAEACD
jgi:TPR repeat protein